MKILFAQSSKAVIGGAELAIKDQIQSLYILGHKPVLLTNNTRLIDAVSGFDWLTRKKVPNLPKIFTPVSWIYDVQAVYKYRPDIVTTHTPREHIGFTITKFLHRKPVVWQDPGDLIHHIRPKRKNILAALNQKLLLWCAARADTLCMLNEEDFKLLSERSDVFLELLSAKRIQILEANILFNNFVLDAQAPVDTKSLVIAFIGRLDKIKGPQYLIEAMGKIKSSEAIELWLVGDGPLMPELKELSKKLRIKCRFFGNQNNVSSFLKRADIIIQPSEFEGWGRSVKEAMYFGKAIIGSRVGGIAAQIEDGKTGLLFEPKNVDELKAKIDLLVKDKSLRQKLGKAARAKALKDGDYVDLVKNKILPLFESVLAKKG